MLAMRSNLFPCVTEFSELHVGVLCGSSKARCKAAKKGSAKLKRNFLCLQISSCFVFERIVLLPVPGHVTAPQVHAAPDNTKKACSYYRATSMYVQGGGRQPTA
jgi:hypothetical protein